MSFKNQCSHWCGNLHRISESRTSYTVGALIERPAEKFFIYKFLSAKRCYLSIIYSEIRTFFRAVNDRPYKKNYTIFRHPFVGDGFPVPRNSQTCMGRDGEPVPYDALTVSPSNSNLPLCCLTPSVSQMPSIFHKTPPNFYRKIFPADLQLIYIPFIFVLHNPRILRTYTVPEEESLWQTQPILRKR